jgi:hypothetical protein
MEIRQIDIEWHPDLPVFACEQFLRSVGDDYGWLGGFAPSGRLRFILPYTILDRFPLRLVRFRVEPILLDEAATTDEERAFLNESIRFFRSTKADLIMPAANTALFRTFPDGACEAPYGTFVIGLGQPEEALWKCIGKDVRSRIRQAQKGGVRIETGMEYLDDAYAVIRSTLVRNSVRSGSLTAFRAMICNLGDNVKVFAAVHRGIVQGCMIAPYSMHSAYSWFSGRRESGVSGAMHLLRWEAIRTFNALGVRCFNNSGSRVDPEHGSKQEGLNSFKSRFGGTFVRGFTWKYPLHPFRYRLYNLAVKLRTGGDVVDQERRVRSSADA